ncbi:transposase [Mycolicibacterium sp. 624]|uniref:transposase n=1 Tax=Mycolicibacterium sp. 624 TaxID=3156314 RepID=UPI003391F6C7
MSLDDDLEKLADAAVTDWPEIAFSGQLDAAIRDLYRSHLLFPQSWSQEECDEFVADNADQDATRLTSRFDDLIDIVTDRYGRQHGFLPHHDDAAAMIAAERKDAVYELEGNIEALSDELTKIATHTAGRAVASMTGCSPASRRSQSKTRRRSR